jgi:hypothetical protein
MWPYWPWPDPRTWAGKVFYFVVGFAAGLVLANAGLRWFG